MASCAGKPSSRTHRAGGMRRGRGLHLQHLLGAKVRVKISEALEHQRLGAGLLCGLLDGNAHSGTEGCDPYFLSTSLLALPGTSVGLGLQTPRLTKPGQICHFGMYPDCTATTPSSEIRRATGPTRQPSLRQKIDCKLVFALMWFPKRELEIDFV